MLNNSHQPISEFDVNTDFDSCYILSSVSQRTTQAGKAYLSGVLSDASDRIPFVMWDNIPSFADADVGKIVYVCGEVQEYRNALQAKVDTLRLAVNSDNYHLSDLVPYAPIDADKATADIYEALKKLNDDLYAPLAIKIFSNTSSFLTKIPAAKTIHHAFVGGWIMHTWNMMRMAEMVYQQYKDIMFIDHDLLIVGTFLHDIGKLSEFILSEHMLVNDYSVGGRLFGHPTLGVMIVEDTVNAYFREADPTKIKLLEHIIVSHHGTPEHGAAVYPQIVEAEIVHLLDSMDSRIEIFREELDKTPAGEFSSFNRALERSVYRHALIA